MAEDAISTKSKSSPEIRGQEVFLGPCRHRIWIYHPQLGAPYRDEPWPPELIYIVEEPILEEETLEELEGRTRLKLPLLATVIPAPQSPPFMVNCMDHSYPSSASSSSSLCPLLRNDRRSPSPLSSCSSLRSLASITSLTSIDEEQELEGMLRKKNSDIDSCEICQPSNHNKIEPREFLIADGGLKQTTDRRSNKKERKPCPGR